MKLGNQAMWALPDTGSFDLVVFGSSCEDCSAPSAYNSSLSLTYREGLLTNHEEYAGDRLVSVIAHDHFAVGELGVENQTFWNVRRAQLSGPPAAPFDAIIGLGPPEAPMADAWEVADAAVRRVGASYEQGQHPGDLVAVEASTRVRLATEVSRSSPPLRGLNVTSFSVCFGAEPGSKGSLVWNDTAPTLRPGFFGVANVSGRHTWSVNLTSSALIRTTGAPMSVGCAEGCSALLDSGSSLLAVPEPVFAVLKERMKALDRRCSNMHVLPSLSFKLGGVAISLPPSSYVARVTADKARRLEHMAPELYTHGQCQLLMARTRARAEAGPVWILGAPFFRRYYAVFSEGEARAERAIYVAPHAGDCAPAKYPAREEPSPRLLPIEADKLRLPQTVQLAATEEFVNL